MGLLEKPDGIDRGEVARYFREGRIREIAEYYESDVVNTYRLWLRYELFCGNLSNRGSNPAKMTWVALSRLIQTQIIPVYERTSVSAPTLTDQGCLAGEYLMRARLYIRMHLRPKDIQGPDHPSKRRHRTAFSASGDPVPHQMGQNIDLVGITRKEQPECVFQVVAGRRGTVGVIDIGADFSTRSPGE
jgi:hypothetical protein